MKKRLNYIIVLLVFVFIGITNIKAITITVPKEVNAGEKIKVEFAEAKISTVSSGPLYEYDHNKPDYLTRVDFNGFSGDNSLFFTAEKGYAIYSTKEIRPLS